MPVVADTLHKAANVRTMVPQVMISIEPVPGMGELVQVSVLDGSYPQADLRRQIKALGDSLGVEVQSLDVIAPGRAGEPVRAFFIVGNIVDTEQGDIRLQPLVRSFLDGPPSHALRRFSVKFIGVVPGAYTTLGSYSSPGATLQAYYDPAALSLEYRILVTADDPAEVDIPSRHDPAANVDAAGREPVKSGLLLALIAVAGVSAGALVYFALLGRRA